MKLIERNFICSTVKLLTLLYLINIYICQLPGKLLVKDILHFKSAITPVIITEHLHQCSYRQDFL